MNILFFFKINESRDNAVRKLKFLSKQLVFPGYFGRLFSCICSNNDTQFISHIPKCVGVSPSRRH